VLNPPYAQRSYSSIHVDGLSWSLLDDLNSGMSWSANIVAVGQYMQIDVGVSMHILGVVTQGRGPSTPGQFVTQFSVQHFETAGGALVTMLGSFSMTDGSKKEHTFATPVYARYIRIVVGPWTGHISMRTAF